MKHFMLKFNHGVEIGAHRAYMGHFNRTENFQIASIAMEEIDHRLVLKQILAWYGEKPNKYIDGTFGIVGSTIAFLCKFFPLRSLNWVACRMEIFAVFSYTLLSKNYPEFRSQFIKMAAAEERHQIYFKRGA